MVKMRIGGALCLRFFPLDQIDPGSARIVAQAEQRGSRPAVRDIESLVISLVGSLTDIENQRRMFLYAGLVIIGSGFFDLVDGRVARASNQVTRFGGFFDSIVDRYSDASLFLGLLVFYGRGSRFFYVVLAALAMISRAAGPYRSAPSRAVIGP